MPTAEQRAEERARRKEEAREQFLAATADALAGDWHAQAEQRWGEPRLAATAAVMNDRVRWSRVWFVPLDGPQLHNVGLHLDYEGHGHWVLEAWHHGLGSQVTFRVPRPPTAEEVARVTAQAWGWEP